jgi:DNA-directed RNA polymerase subunit RPC12/RpoP
MKVAGTALLACRSCHTQWTLSRSENTLRNKAHCPRCLSRQLSNWNPEHYHTPLPTYLRILVGAYPFRCLDCRHNFASFDRVGAVRPVLDPSAIPTELIVSK